MCFFPKAPPDPKLPPNPIQKKDPADFEPISQSRGKSGRAGQRALRIKRSQAGGGFGNVGGSGSGPVRIGAQVPA